MGSSVGSQGSCPWSPRMRAGSAWPTLFRGCTWPIAGQSRPHARPHRCCVAAANAEFIPDYEANLDVKDFGARGDGKTGRAACIVCLELQMWTPACAVACASPPPSAGIILLH